MMYIDPAIAKGRGFYLVEYISKIYALSNVNLVVEIQITIKKFKKKSHNTKNTTIHTHTQT